MNVVPPNPAVEAYPEQGSGTASEKPVNYGAVIALREGASADVGLVPYGISRFNIGSFPLKTLEYLAAGLPVVSTPLPGVEWLASDDVRVADGPEAFSAAVRSVLGAGRTESDDRRRREFAAAHSWDRRAAAFAEALGILEGDALAAGGAAA